MSYILYQLAGEPVNTFFASNQISIEEAVSLTVPSGANYKIVETLPVYDSTVYQLELTPEGSPEPYEIVPFPLTDSKDTYVSAVKEKAYSILQPTDWLVIRQAEAGTPIPTGWDTYRADVRTEADTKIAAIEGAADAAALEAYVTSPPYETWPTPPLGASYESRV